MKQVEKYTGSFFLLIIIAGSVFPFIYMGVMSLKNTLSVRDFNLDNLTMANYVKIFQTAEFERYFFNSVFVALAGVALAVIVSCLAGYAFAKIKFPGNDLIFFIFIMTLIVPSEVIIVPLYLTIKNLGWLNTYQALILPLPTALGTFIMRQAILGVPMKCWRLRRWKVLECKNIMEDYYAFKFKPAILTLGNFYFCRGMEQFLMAFDCKYKK